MNTPKRNRRRALLFRIATVALSLSPLLVLEAALRAGGYQGRDSAQLDPFVAFDDVRPLFELRGDGSMATPSSRLEYFRPEQFQAVKPAGQYRIFCLGGSTVQGRPFAIETSFTTWLELSLRAAEPRRDWEVVNCGGVSYASYRLTPIANEVLGYQPDLIILYTGHNEFLEERTYASLRGRPAWVRQAGRAMDHVRSFRLARNLFWSGGQRDTLASEVDAILDYRSGLEQYHRDDAWRDIVVEHYETNIRRMISLCETAGVPLIVCNPVSNLGDSPPFKVESGALSAKQLEQFERLWQQALPDAGQPLESRIELLQQAAVLNPRHAGVHYQLGKCLQAARRWDGAYAALVRAKDEDVCPLRMLEPMHAGLRQAVMASSAGWVDVRAHFQQQSPGGIPGKKWMVDHVHPSIFGHQRIALWLMEELQRRGVVAPQEDYLQLRQSAYQEHLEQLPAIYYEQGKRRLEGLQRWSQGRAFKVRQ